MHSRRGNGYACVALALLAATAGVVHAQEFKVAVFDAQTVLQNSEVGKRLEAEVNSFGERKQAEMDELRTEIDELRQRLAQQGLSLSVDRRSSMEKDIQRRMLDLESAQESATREMQLELASAERSFQEKLLRAVDAFAAEEGFTLMLESNQIAWADKSIDVTTAVIDKINALYPASGAATDSGQEP